MRKLLLPLWGFLAACTSNPVPVDMAGVGFLQEMAHQYPNEVAACFYEEGFEIAETKAAGTTWVSPEGCDEGATAIAHTHPQAVATEPSRFLVWYEANRGHAPRGPEDLCYLSQPDREYFRNLEEPPDYNIVAVDRDTWCWWTADQVLAAPTDTPMHFPPRGQLVTNDS